MLQITTTKFSNQDTNAVSARELHAGLELKTQFTDWVKQFLDDFIQGTDFIIDTVTTVDVQTDGHRVTRNLVNYLFSLDMAKQIAMLTRTAKGKEVRLYFIECEKKLKQQTSKLPITYLEALENLVVVEKERARLQSVNNALMHVNKLYSSTEIAKELGLRSGSQLNTALKEKKIQYKTGGTWVLYAGYSEMDLISIKQDISPSGHTFYDRRWTQCGRKFILALFGVMI